MLSASYVPGTVPRARLRCVSLPRGQREFCKALGGHHLPSLTLSGPLCSFPPALPLPVFHHTREANFPPEPPRQLGLLPWETSMMSPLSGPALQVSGYLRVSVIICIEQGRAGEGRTSTGGKRSLRRIGLETSSPPPPLPHY